LNPITRTLSLPAQIGARPEVWVPRVLQSGAAETRQVRTGTLPIFVLSITLTSGWAPRVLDSASEFSRKLDLVFSSGTLPMPTIATGPYFRQPAQNITPSPTLNVLDWSFPTLAGSTLAVFAIWTGSIIITPPAGWSSGSVITVHTTTKMQAFWLPTAAAQSVTTFTVAGVGPYVLYGGELANLASNILDVNLSASGTSATASAGPTGTLANASEILFTCVGASPSPALATAVSGLWTPLGPESNASVSLSPAWLVVNSTTSQQATFTMNVSCFWAGIVLSFR